MNWDQHKSTWPNAALSRIVTCRPHRWHVQRGGTGPRLLLLHGAGGATHSWRDVIPDLMADHEVLAVDLPGHGFTQLGTRHRSGLDHMAEDLTALLAAEDFAPRITVGHSAGAAVALRIALDGPQPKGVLTFNAALGNFPGLAGWLFPIMAKLLAINPLTAIAFAKLSSANSSKRLIDSTGSNIDAAGLAQYGALITDRAHVDGALNMMAQWSLDRLLADLPRLDIPVHLIAAANDKTVPAETSAAVAARMPAATSEIWQDLGHLAHEEVPEKATCAIRAFAAILP
ncbi:MAG: alpha/beta fold hydrolase BchO [Pseudomonadota bacterium]